MSRSFKPNDGYIDSRGIVDNRTLLSDVLNYTLRKKGSLTYTTNFNDISSAGIYIYNGWVGNDTGSNRPTNTRSMGFLLVLLDPTWGNCMQIYFCSSSSIGIKYRFYGDGVWYNWLNVSVSK